jgi:tripartite-type tricarboxylate transporter receptor subunit TctC
MLFSPAPVAMGFIGSGRFLVLAQSGAERLASLPDVPTLIEAGFAGFDSPLWWGMFAPVGTPAAIMDRWQAALEQVVAEPETRAWLAKMGYAPRPMTRAQFAHLVMMEQARWKR